MGELPAHHCARGRTFREAFADDRLAESESQLLLEFLRRVVVVVQQSQLILDVGRADDLPQQDVGQYVGAAQPQHIGQRLQMDGMKERMKNLQLADVHAQQSWLELDGTHAHTHTHTHTYTG